MSVIVFVISSSSSNNNSNNHIYTRLIAHSCRCDKIIANFLMIEHLIQSRRQRFSSAPLYLLLFSVQIISLVLFALYHAFQPPGIERKLVHVYSHGKITYDLPDSLFRILFSFFYSKCTVFFLNEKYSDSEFQTRKTNE